MDSLCTGSIFVLWRSLYLLSAVYAIDIKAPVVPPETNTFSHVFQTAFVEKPLLYAAVLSCWRGVIGILAMTFGFVLAMYCKIFL